MVMLPDLVVSMQSSVRRKIKSRTDSSVQILYFEWIGIESYMNNMH